MTAIAKKAAASEAAPTKATNPGSTPTPMATKLTLCALTVNAKCGGCKHFKRLPHPAYVKVCSEKGVVETGKPCVRFSVDPTVLKLKESEHLQALASILEGIPTDQLPLVAALINQENRTRKRGFYYGQLVYLKPFGGDYVSNYRKCRVISADNNFVHVQASEGWVASVHHESVLKPREWKRKHAELQAAKKIKDPNFKRYYRVPTKAEQDLKKFLETNAPLPLDRDNLERDIFVAVEKRAAPRRDARKTELTELLKVR